MFSSVRTVSSSCFKRISYDTLSNLLYVTFKTTNRTYAYKVSSKVFLDFIKSESKGQFYNAFIKPYAQPENSVNGEPVS